MGHTRQLEVFGVRRWHRHEDFWRKKNKGTTSPLIPLPTWWQKIRNNLRFTIGATSARGWEHQPGKSLILILGIMKPVAEGSNYFLREIKTSSFFFILSSFQCLGETLLLCNEIIKTYILSSQWFNNKVFENPLLSLLVWICVSWHKKYSFFLL